MPKEVIVYHQPNCGPCRSVMEYLTQKGVPFVSKDVFTDTQAQQEMIALGSQSTPTVKVGTEVMIGFSPSKLNKMLAA